jgi:hypothetical protein
MNFKEIYTRVQNYINDDTSTTLTIIKESINQKALELLQRSLWTWSLRETTITTAGSTSEYYLPRDLDKILDIRQKESPIQLRRVWPGDFDRLVPDPTYTGDPSWYMLLLEERVNAQPTAAGKVVVYSTSDSDVSPETGSTAATLYGVSSGVDRSEVVTLSATNEVSSTNTYTKLYSIAVNPKPVGSLYFRQLTVGTALLTLFPNEISKTYKKIQFYPIPTQTATIYIKYQATQPTLINDSDVLVIPDRFSNVLVEMVVADHLLRQGDPKATARIQMAEKMIEQIKREQDMFWDYVPAVRAQDVQTGQVDYSNPFTYY